MTRAQVGRDLEVSVDTIGDWSAPVPSATTAEMTNRAADVARLRREREQVCIVQMGDSIMAHWYPAMAATYEQQS